MNLDVILQDLRDQRSRLDQAIDALQRTPHRGPPITSGVRRRMSTAARAKISAAKKAWWAKQKRKSAVSKSKPSSKSAIKRRLLSAAARTKLSALMKARWAAKKKAA